MIEIKDLPLKFQNLLVKEEVKTYAVTQTIREILNIEINKKDVKIKNSTVFLNIKPIYKNEIFLNKEKISAKLAEYLGVRYPKDIR